MTAPRVEQASPPPQDVIDDPCVGPGKTFRWAVKNRLELLEQVRRLLDRAAS